MEPRDLGAGWDQMRLAEDWGHHNPRLCRRGCEKVPSGGTSEVQHGTSPETASPFLGKTQEKWKHVLNTDVHSSTIRMSPKEETTKMPIN